MSSDSAVNYATGDCVVEPTLKGPPLREIGKEGRVTPKFAPTGKMHADCGTKHLAKIQLRSIFQQRKEFSG